MRIYLLLSFLALNSVLVAQNSIQEILTNARHFDLTVEQADAYFAEKYPGLKHSELCEGVFRDGDFVKYMRWKAYWSERLNPDGTLGDPTRFYRENGAQRGDSEYADIEWTNISYSDYMEVQIGMGRTTSIGFHPTDPDTYFVGAAIGGVWKTTDGGETYEPIGDELPFLAVSQILVHPTNPDTIYIAVSDHVWYGPPSIGVYKTVDGGENWSATNFTFDLAQNIRIYWLAMNPEDPDHILAATADGLFLTLDGFETSEQINSFDSRDVKFHPTNPNIVHQGSSGGGFYRSTNGGMSFTPIANLGEGETRIAVTPLDSNKVYVRSGNTLARSFDAGLTFNEDYTLPEDGGILMFDPQDDETLIAGFFEVWKSEDGGASFDVKTNWLGNGGLPLIHVDHRNAFTNPLQDDRLYICNDGGVFAMDIANESFTELCSGLEITQFYDIAVSQSDPNVIAGGSQDNGNVYRDSDGDWDLYAISGDGMNQDINTETEDVRYWSYQFGAIHRSNGPFSVSAAPIGESGNGAWETPYKIDPSNNDRLISAYNRVYESNNQAVSWTPISEELHIYDMEQLAIAPSNGERIYVVRGNEMWVKDIFSDEWTEESLPASSISDIEVDPVDFDKVYISSAGYSDGNKVFVSYDAGQNWDNISGELPNVSTGAIETYTPVSGGLFVGTEAGVYYRDDFNPEWQIYGSFPNTRVEDIEIQYSAQLIRIGTHGRGVLEAPVAIGICQDGEGDADLDGICDDFDTCPDFDDYLLGTPCDDGDDSTVDDVYVDCGVCEGIYYVGMSESTNNVFGIYPNPSNGMVTVDLKHADNAIMEVYNMNGQLVFQEKIDTRTQQVDMSNLTTAIYLVQVKTLDGKQIGWERLVVE